MIGVGFALPNVAVNISISQWPFTNIADCVTGHTRNPIGLPWTHMTSDWIAVAPHIEVMSQVGNNNLKHHYHMAILNLYSTH